MSEYTENDDLQDEEKNNEEISSAVEDDNDTGDRLHSQYNLPTVLDEKSLHHLPGMFYTWYFCLLYTSDAADD